jgi:hypothetical protein
MPSYWRGYVDCGPVTRAVAPLGLLSGTVFTGLASPYLLT